jgi:hypothetical protein
MFFGGGGGFSMFVVCAGQKNIKSNTHQTQPMKKQQTRNKKIHHKKLAQ